MSKSTVFVGAIAVAALAVGGAGLAWQGYNAFANQDRREITGELTEVNLDQVAGYKPDKDSGDLSMPLVHELQGGNTKLLWHCGKDLVGTRHDFNGTWDVLSGAIVFNPKLQQLKALEVRILLESIVGYGADHPAPSGLTNTVIDDQWFKTEQYPEAVFVSTAFEKRGPETPEIAGAPEGWTHLIKGKFTLNSAEAKEIEIPALVTFTGEAVQVEVAFQVNRKDYGIDGTGGGPVDDLVDVAAVVTATQDPANATKAMAGMLQDYGSTIAAQATMIDQLQTQVAVLNETLGNLERQVGAGVGPARPAVDTSDLPAKFTDTITRYNFETKTEKSPVSFDMVLVPGDAAKGIGPFYMASHEVTWEMFNDWAYSTDIHVDVSATLQQKDLRPSPLYEDCAQVKMGKGERPAVSMSRTTAEAFAKYLTEVTGRNYRLPTDAEWQHALEAGGGVPQDRAELLAQAWLDDNAERFSAGGGGGSDAFDPFASEEPEPESEEVVGMSAPVGTAKPNKLGIYDMLGNAAEWVVGTGADRIVRGGHFQLPADQFSADWKSLEDQKVWNATYPQKPNSRFWYRDHYYQGIRLVCDPVNIPE